MVRITSTDVMLTQAKVDDSSQQGIVLIKERPTSKVKSLLHPEALQISKGSSIFVV